MKKAALPYKTILLTILALVVSIVIGTSAAYIYLGSTGASRQVAQTPTPTPKPATKEELLALVNEERAKAGVAPLVVDERLNQSAQRKADDMTKYNYFNHISPNDGKNGYEYVYDTGIYCKYAGENLTQNYSYYEWDSRAVRSWMNSKSHRDAMLDSRYTLTGFGKSGVNVVEHFCEQ